MLTTYQQHISCCSRQNFPGTYLFQMHVSNTGGMPAPGKHGSRSASRRTCRHLRRACRRRRAPRSAPPRRQEAPERPGYPSRLPRPPGATGRPGPKPCRPTRMGRRPPPPEAVDGRLRVRVPALRLEAHRRPGGWVAAAAAAAECAGPATEQPDTADSDGAVPRRPRRGRGVGRGREPHGKAGRREGGREGAGGREGGGVWGEEPERAARGPS